jgi:hypothetical protein
LTADACSVPDANSLKAFQFPKKLRLAPLVCEIGVGKDPVDNTPYTLVDWKVIMNRRSRNQNFDATLENLRAHSFDVVPFAGVASGILVSKYGAAAVLIANNNAPAAFAQRPGALVGGEVARLIDRGYQKFIQASRYEIPATASQLHAIHLFSEELKQVVGAISFYNESLGTTSDLYQYDRLKGREAAQPASVQSVELAEGH